MHHNTVWSGFDRDCTSRSPTGYLDGKDSIERSGSVPIKSPAMVMGYEDISMAVVAGISYSDRLTAAVQILHQQIGFFIGLSHPLDDSVGFR